MGNPWVRLFRHVVIFALLTTQVGALSFRPKSELAFVPAKVTVGDLANISPETEETRFSTIDTGVVLHYPTLYSPERIVSIIDRSIEGSFAYVGGPSIVVPLSYEGSLALPFLEKLLLFLKREFYAGYEKLEIIPIQSCPIIRKSDRVDFFLAVEAEDTYEVLYRRAGKSSYKRSGVLVRKTDTAHVVHVSAPTGPVRIRNGQSITILIVSGTIRAELEGVALESGRREDLIKVKIEETGKEIDARISGPAEVRVDL